MKTIGKVMRDFNFKYIPQEGCDAWSKIYKGFILFIVKAPNGKLLSCLKIGELEIGLPDIINIKWIIDFNNENK